MPFFFFGRFACHSLSLRLLFGLPFFFFGRFACYSLSLRLPFGFICTLPSRLMRSAFGLENCFDLRELGR
ncbi:MAG: hypothetical protein A2107_13415 [Verrucomicrobia bacterium GWF2_62_7]|nr:MAG: hypothetical protein A2107_13415 [Verrucomicrobia bacterium GWF2_62_7]